MTYFTTMRLVQIFWLSLMMLSMTGVQAQAPAISTDATVPTKTLSDKSVTLASTSAVGKPASAADAASRQAQASDAQSPPNEDAATTPSAGHEKAAGTNASAVRAPAQQEMDLAALEDRLVDTDAIGFFTKLELKSQIDELTEKFREFHALGAPAGGGKLGGLREEFDLLLLKVLTLLQDDDPTLHRDVAMARPQIWQTFSDPELFAKL